MDELNRSNALDSSVPQKNGWVFTGEFDFYKVISIASKCITRIQSYNMHGQLNRASKILNRQIPILVACLPTRIVNFEFKPNSTNTLELYMDGGWQLVSLYIAATYIMRLPKSKQVWSSTFKLSECPLRLLLLIAVGNKEDFLLW